jgi:Polyketide cyclase / dehydrase and lipid transport
MVEVVTRIQIARPLKKVADYATNADNALKWYINNAPKWYINIISAEWKTPKPLVLGSQVAFIAHFLGKKLAWTYEVTELMREEKIVMQTSDGPFPIETTYTWKSTGDFHTKMTLGNKMSPSGFSRLMAPFIAMMLKWSNKKDLKKLKEILERPC